MLKKLPPQENVEKAGNTVNAEEGSNTVNVQGAEKDSSDNMYREVVQEAEMEKPAEKLDKIHVEEICLNFKCDQCEYTNITARGLSQHTRMKHRISQLDGHIDEITADVAVQTLDVKNYKDSVTQTEEVKEDEMKEPFELKFKIPEKRFSSDIYDLYLEEPMPQVMPKTILHPLDGVGELVEVGFYMGFKNIYRYLFKLDRGVSCKNFHIGKRPPGF